MNALSEVSMMIGIIICAVFLYFVLIKAIDAFYDQETPRRKRKKMKESGSGKTDPPDDTPTVLF
jgi:hypothetical protein